nr:sugar ABC transporter permease [uncultured Acetatifactor sp.]
MHDKKIGISKKARDRLFIAAFLLPGLAMILVMLYYPAADGVVMAFQNVKAYNIFSREFYGLENFRKLFGNATYLGTWKNTFIWVAGCVAFEFILGFGIALLLQKPFKGRKFYECVVFMPWALSGFMVGIMWKWMFNGSNGVINDILIRFGIVERQVGFLSNPDYALGSVMVAKVWTGMAFFAIITMAALKTIPWEMYEAAAIDGAGAFTNFFYITLPSIRVILLLMVLMRTVQTMNAPDLIFGMTQGGPAGSSHIASSYIMTEVIKGNDYGLVSAAGVVLWLVTLLFTGIYLVCTNALKGGDE